MYIIMNVMSIRLFLGCRLGTDRLRLLEPAFDPRTIVREECGADGLFDEASQSETMRQELLRRVIRTGPPLLRGNLSLEREQEYEAKEIEPVAPITGPGIGTGHHRHRIDLLVRPHRRGDDDILWQFASPEQEGADRLLLPAKIQFRSLSPFDWAPPGPMPKDAQRKIDELCHVYFWNARLAEQEIIAVHCRGLRIQ